METIFGLPAHALLVHIPVALIPLSALGAIVIAVSERWRDRIGWVVVGVAGFATIASQFAVTSGEELEEAVDENALIDRHAELAETFFWVALAFFAVVLALMVWDTVRRRRIARGGPATAGRTAGIVLSVLVIAASLGVCVRVYQVGHSGAKAVWQEQTDAVGGGEEADERENGEG